MVFLFAADGNDEIVCVELQHQVEQHLCDNDSVVHFDNEMQNDGPFQTSCIPVRQSAGRMNDDGATTVRMTLGSGRVVDCLRKISSSVSAAQAEKHDFVK